MSTPIALLAEHVFKKFRKGERHNSLRDFIPSLAKRMAQRMAGNDGLEKEEFWALRDVSFEVRQGEALGIIGHNGAGKSTILKHLSGLMQPTSGRIHVNGRLSALIEVGAGFHQDLTGRENVFLNGVILGMTRAEVRRKFDEIVAFAGVEEFIDTPVKRYSSGMYARLGFSVAAHMEPDILIVDEVLSVGDYLFQAKSIEKMRSVAASGTTVIFVSHNLRSMADLCHRAILLRKGRVVEDGETSHVIHTYMEQAKQARVEDKDQEVVIDSVTVRGSDRARYDFESGEKAYVDVKVRAQRPVSKIACVLYLLDDMYYEVFNTSSERLGAVPPNLAAGETVTYTFELNLHLAVGTFHICASLYRYDTGKLYDQVRPAATLLMRSAIDARGAVNLYPRLYETKLG